MCPDNHAVQTPEKPAVVMAGGESRVSYADLVARSRRLAHALRRTGLKTGDTIAFVCDNRAEVFELVWAAQRMGLYFVPINWHLQVDEAAYIISDSGARVIFVSDRIAELAAPLLARISPDLLRIVVGESTLPGYLPYGEFVAQCPATALPDETEGTAMVYSSGTSGQPKGIKRPLRGTPFGTQPPMDKLIIGLFGIDANTVYLSPAPLYHMAPLGWSMIVQRAGGTVVVMKSFDAQEALDLIAEHRVTHVQMVPTHFVRMLRLPEAARRRADLSSLRYLIHAAAPCPVDVKERMIDWLGPIVWEFYAASEGNGFCMISPQEWLSHRGSVGRSMLGKIRILDEGGNELPPGEVGGVWFEGGLEFSYHNDPAKTAEARDAAGRTTVGDLGYLDAEGYLYLSDRRSHLIISGGVNIYPQEIENALALHPKVEDVAVIGVPNEEFGEEVKAVVVAAPGIEPGAELAEELMQFCRERIARYKCPRSVDFVEELPRMPTGKLVKRLLMERYRATPAG